MYIYITLNYMASLNLALTRIFIVLFYFITYMYICLYIIYIKLKIVEVYC